MQYSRVWTKDRAPLEDWRIDFEFHKQLHLSLADIEQMSAERRSFYIGLLEEIDRQEQIAIKKGKEKRGRSR